MYFHCGRTFNITVIFCPQRTDSLRQSAGEVHSGRRRAMRSRFSMVRSASPGER